MKSFLLLVFFGGGLFYTFLSAQDVAGKIIDQNGKAVASSALNLWVNSKMYTTTSAIDGSFVFRGVTSVEDESILPAGYFVSNNYPNPFNPKTRIEFTLPQSSTVTIEVYNITGQKVLDNYKNNFNAGNNYIDLELRGLANGVYFAKIKINEKYSITKKLLLLYGSQHLDKTYKTYQLKNNIDENKERAFTDIKIDSLVIFGPGLYSKTYKIFKPLKETYSDLGTLRVITPCPGIPYVLYEGKTYHTVLINKQCWMKENLNVGEFTDSPYGSPDINNVKKHCYNNDTANCEKYGGLYDWYDALKTTSGFMFNPPRGICPLGWHVPIDVELASFINYIEKDGNKIKNEGEGIGNGIGTNESGFSLLLNSNHAQNYTSLWGAQGAGRINYFSYFGVQDSSSVISNGYTSSGWRFYVRCLMDNIISAPSLSLPLNNSLQVQRPVYLLWDYSEYYNNYYLQVAKDSLFANLVYSKAGNIRSTNKTLDSLEASTTYYWRVRYENSNGVSPFSEVWCFTTAPAFLNYK